MFDQEFVLKVRHQSSDGMGGYQPKNVAPRAGRGFTVNTLGSRMKQYERTTDAVLPGRLPVIIRVDGRAFHSYTRGLPRPWCAKLADALDHAAIALCEELHGAKLAYCQSDEISVLLVGYEQHDTEPCFGNRVQKLASIAASIAAAEVTARSESIFGRMKVAHFDARVFVVGEDDVANYFWWRQQDASRNSIQSLAQSLYSQKQLHKKNQSALHELCFQKGHNWSDLPAYWKRGRTAVRVADPDGRSRWTIDREIPIWKGEGRQYIERHLPGLRQQEAAE